MGLWGDAPAYKMRLKEGPRTFPKLIIMVLDSTVIIVYNSNARPIAHDA